MVKIIKFRLYLLSVLLLFGICLSAAPSTYLFCVKSDEFPTFKASVFFRAVDFGENAARQMVINRIKPHLTKEFEVSRYNSNVCPCESECPLLEVTAEDWGGNLEDAGAATYMGSAAESLDMIMYNAREIFNNPGGFIKKTFFGAQKLTGN